MTAPALSAWHERAQQRREQVVELTRCGHTAPEIAVILRLSARHVARIRSEQGIAQPKAPTLTAAEIRLAGELLDSGASYNEVARTIGRSAASIRRQFPGRGWPIGEGPRLAQFRRWIRSRAPELEGL